MKNRNTKKSNEEFIKECVDIYGDEYDYSKVEYTSNKNKVLIGCKKHGYVEVIPIKFLKGRGCPKCSKSKTKPIKKSTTEEFIEKSRKIHGDKYDYSKVEYINAKEKVCIICSTHGEFWQRPNDHLNGNGCKECSNIFGSKTHDEFLKECIDKFDGKFICDKTFYKNHMTKVTFFCEKHGYFEQYPKTFLEGTGCPKCKWESFMLNENSFIERCKKIHNNKYDYSLVKYKGCFNYIDVICHEHDRFGNEHGIFKQMASHHVSGAGCPKCKNKWFLEEDIRNFLKSKTFIFEEHNRKILNGLELDFYIPSKKLAIECQGIQHFKPVDFHSCGEERTMEEFKKILEHDEKKRKLCEEQGIKLLYYSNLGIDYPYQVYEDKEELLKEILK